ncbi:hypothetical protein AB4304_03595 [Vibrio breoganii]|uniref:hypothetical protein n=1 Tax=Vibrio breoganii TaxID=553239 RepID=UPI000C8248B3|nr:hypothetical protein [Vibrio breoganii]PMK47724.1 hypothetical protein BCU00_05135 [Vibrio breoganii]TKG23305.1 hypothetical protein FCV84_00165 [Vibrio breoganii]
MSNRAKIAQTIMDGMIEGQIYTKERIASITTEDSGRIMDYIRTKHLIPVECVVSHGIANWYIRSAEAFRYRHKRGEQKSTMKKIIKTKRLQRLANQFINVANAGDLKLLEAMVARRIGNNKANI